VEHIDLPARLSYRGNRGYPSAAPMPHHTSTELRGWRRTIRSHLLLCARLGKPLAEALTQFRRDHSRRGQSHSTGRTECNDGNCQADCCHRSRAVRALGRGAPARPRCTCSRLRRCDVELASAHAGRHVPQVCSRRFGFVGAYPGYGLADFSAASGTQPLTGIRSCLSRCLSATASGFSSNCFRR